MNLLSTKFKQSSLVTFAGLAITSAVLIWPIGSNALAQPSQADTTPSDAPTMAEQIAQLRASVARLEVQAERERRASGGSKGGMGGKGMGPDSKGGGMGGGKDNGKGGMGGGNKGGSMSGMGGKGGMGSKGGGQKGGGQKYGGMMGSGAGTSAMGTMSGSASEEASLPGFPGASHLYHIGADDFFLDHDEHITLSIEQRAALGQIREQSQLQSATFDRQIAELEQELWVLTASDTPDIVEIEKKVRETARVAGDQRLAFIRSVGVSAQVLSENQRDILVGDQPVEADDSTEISL